MWRRVDLVWTDVSEERIVFVFRVEKSANEEQTASHLLSLVPRSRIFLPWRWRRYVLPKRRFIQDLHGATPQKTAFFIVTALKTTNSTNILSFIICTNFLPICFYYLCIFSVFMVSVNARNSSFLYISLGTIPFFISLWMNLLICLCVRIYLISHFFLVYLLSLFVLSFILFSFLSTFVILKR
jgi:hypothetical protein